MPRSTLVHAFRPVNSVNQNSFHSVPSSRLASDEAGFVAPTSLPSCVEGHNNILPGGVNEKTKEETCAIASSYREKENGQQLGTSGRVEEQSTTCGKATARRRMHDIVAQFFLNWHSHSYSSPRSSSTVRPSQNPPPIMIAAASQSISLSPASAPHGARKVEPPANAQAKLSTPRTAPPVSPSLDEIHAKLICNLARVRYGALWNISGKSFVLFADETTGTSLAVPLDGFCVQAVRSHVRASRERFGIWEEL